MIKDFFKFDRSRLVPLIGSLLIFLLISLMYTQLRILDGMENGSIDFRFFLRAPSQKSEKIKEGVSVTQKNPKARDDIIILGIDANTINDFNNKGIVWPFPWNVHAKFTRFVGSGNPQALFFDIMFVDHKEYEDEFADAMKQAGMVFLDYLFETKSADIRYSDIDERIKQINRTRFPLDPDDTYPTWVEEIVPVIPSFGNAAKGTGFANVRTDPDHINRKMPLLIKFNDYYYPSIDLILCMNYFQITEKDVEIEIGKYIKLKNLPEIKMAKPNKNREIIIPIDEQGFMDINFVGGFGSFNYYPYMYFHQDGTFSNKSLQDKIILVAAYAITGIASDTHKSPYGETFGIEHHANALNTILNQDFIIRLAEWQNVLILLILALLLGFLLPRISIVKSMIFTIMIILLYIVGAFVLFDSVNLICTFSTALFQIAITFTFVIAYRVLTEQKEKKYIRQTFSKYVSKSVVDELLLDPEKLKLGGEKKIMTVLFSDIRGFTSISEKLTPEALVEHLNQYLEAMTDIVFEYDGTLDKYVGDAIMAFWGAPMPQDDHAIRACRACIKMMDVLEKMNKNWVTMGKPILEIGIGLNSGDMVVGNMGSSTRMSYTLMGDNVNLGSRLEGTNKVYKTHIIISEFTYEMVKDKVIARELDLIRVKGKAQPVKIYELIDVVG